ncbi:hypothetical protein [Intestinimonas butyriciproducens]|uniref:Uncharacterized protein n=1 Tax=Intestinimonas butyriciproducens TaxID=1297617 RepID=A0A0S2VZV6_9FIRM|nr:hypothetical protein [Intestinimonas butyriciproducens]ALP92514.1 hypothetical protein IB211_00118c [Intestinimonas butyriciproducens]
MSENNNSKTMYETVPAAAELNKVPGFDPLKFLRRTRDFVKLDLPYQKLWFRMAHPNGRMRLTALRITEQMAIFEAKVFLDRSDAEPFSMSVAQQSTQDSRNYVKAAQDAALSQALSDAGFGIQMVSAEVQADQPVSGAAASAPPVTVASKPMQPPAQTPKPQTATSAAQTAAAASDGKVTTASQRAPEPHQRAATGAASISERKPQEELRLPVEAAAPAAPAEAPVQQPKQPETAAGKVVELSIQSRGDGLPAGGADEAQTAPDPQQAASAMEQTPAYTQDMPVDEILKTMTLEQARQVVVENGVYKGKTIAQVAQQRPVSLRFYLTPGNTSKNNIIRAAARLVLDSLEQAG